MRAKFVSVFIFIFIVFLAVLIWRVDQLMYQDKLTWNEAQSRAQMSAVVRALEIEQASMRDALQLGFPIVEQKNKDYPLKTPYSRFQVMLDLAPPAGDAKDWKILKKFYLEKSDMKTWAEQYLTLALSTLKPEMVPNDGALFLSLMDPKRKPVLLTLLRAEVSEGSEKWLAALSSLDGFQGIADRQKGQMSQIFVVNSRGEALGHTIPEYVGSRLSEDPLVAELIRAKTPSGSGLFADLRGEQIQGFYEQIDGTNLYALVSTPLASLVASRESTWLQVSLLGLGLCFLGVALFLMSVRNETPRPQRVVVSSSPVAGKSMQGVQGVNSLPPMPSSSEDKMSIYTRVASALSHELNAPITAALGHAQIAKAAAVKLNATMGMKVEKIEADLRVAREILQKLLIFAGEDKFKDTHQSLDQVVAKVLKNFEGRLISKGIKLHKNLVKTPSFDFSQDLVMRAIENVLQNAVEAMDRSPKKEISVDLEQINEKIILSIKDTGEGIEPLDIEKVFDPFFTRRSHSKHSGLGLSATLGILSSMKGDVKLQSEKGKGTTVKLYFTTQLQDAADLPELTKDTSIRQAKAGNLPPPPSPLLDPIVEKENNEESAPINIPLMEKREGAVPPPPLSDPFLNDESLEKMIDQGPDLPEDISEKTIVSGAGIPLMVNDAEVASEPPLRPSAPVDKSAAKIDRPKMKPRRESGAHEEVMMIVRKPGEKS